MLIADICMIDIIPLRDASQQRARVLRQRVKVELIDDKADEGGDPKREYREHENGARTGPDNASNVRACHLRKYDKKSV